RDFHVNGVQTCALPILGSLLKDKTKSGELIRKHFASLFAYVSNKVPEISDNLYSIDDAMKTGYAWKYAPFETWDLVGLKNGLDRSEERRVGKECGCSQW